MTFILILKPDESIHPNADEEWQIVSGIIGHITTSISMLQLATRGKVPVAVQSIIGILAASSSGGYALNPLNPTYTVFMEGYCSDSRGVWFDPTINIMFAGGVNSRAALLIERRKIGEVEIIQPDIQVPTEKKRWWWPF